MAEDTPHVPEEIVLRPVSSLTPYAANSRTHTDEQVGLIADSIREFGFTNPVLLDADQTIIAGHARVLAAERLGMTQVPTVELGHLTETQIRAYVIADNQLALKAGWDHGLLKLELEGLLADDFDVGLLGFEQLEIDGLLSAADEKENQAPLLPDETAIVPGDLFELGPHRLLCGDSTLADHVDRLLDGVQPHIMVTDPPYGVEYNADWRNQALREDGGAIGGRAIGEVKNDDRADWSEAWALFPGDVAYVWHAGNKSHIVAESLMRVGFELRAQIIWAKHRLVIGRGHYHPQHEPCWYAVRNRGHWNGSRQQTTLWHIEHSKSDTGHSTQKPVEAMRRPIENNSSIGQAVYEPFCGSGTTIIAAEQTKRVCYAMELDPLYVDVAVRRWEDYTGQKAKKHGTA